MAYAVRTDIPKFGIAAEAIADIATTTQDAALSSASRFMDGFLRAALALPLIAYGDDLRECCCVLAVETLIFGRGIAPGGIGGADQPLIDRADRWRKWLGQVSSGKVLLDVTESAVGPVYAPEAVSDESREQ